MEKMYRRYPPSLRAGRFAETACVLEEAVHYAEHFPALDVRLPDTIHTLAFVDQQMGKYKATVDVLDLMSAR
jgi:hypothetical protein